MRSAAPVLRLIAAAALAGLAGAADPAPDVPDPIGLGPRLALIDYLRDEWKLSPPPQASYEELCKLYWAEHRRRHPPAPVVDEAAAAQERERVKQLASELNRRGLSIPPEADARTLEALLKRADENRDHPAPVLAGGKSPAAPAAEAAPVAETAAPAAPAMPPPILPAEWKAALAELWKTREEQVVVGTALGWSSERPPVATTGARFRVRRAGGDWQSAIEQPPPDPALEVQERNMEKGPSADGPAVFRWRPVWWDPVQKYFSGMPPAQQNWTRDSGASLKILRFLIRATDDSADRERDWSRLRTPLDRKAVLAAGALPPDLAAVFAASARVYCRPLPLADIELETYRIDEAYRRLLIGQNALLSAQEAADGNPADPAVAACIVELRDIAGEIIPRCARRRDLFLTVLTTLGIPH